MTSNFIRQWQVLPDLLSPLYEKTDYGLAWNEQHKPRSVNTSVWESNLGSAQALSEGDWQLEEWYLCITQNILSIIQFDTGARVRRGRTEDGKKDREGGHMEVEATYLV